MIKWFFIIIIVISILVIYCRSRIDRDTTNSDTDNNSIAYDKLQNLANPESEDSYYYDNLQVEETDQFWDDIYRD
jgi:hypothetical protein